jgi:hypothetical protein
MPDFFDRAEYVAVAVIALLIIGPLGLGRWMASGITWRPGWMRRPGAPSAAAADAACGKCGAPLADDARFCTACGAQTSAG